MEVRFDQSTRREAWWGGVIVNEFSDKKGAQWVGVQFDDGDSHTYDYDHCISNGTLRKEEKQEVSRAPRPTHAAHTTHLLVQSSPPHEDRTARRVTRAHCTNTITPAVPLQAPDPHPRSQAESEGVTIGAKRPRVEKQTSKNDPVLRQDPNRTQMTSACPLLNALRAWCATPPSPSP